MIVTGEEAISSMGTDTPLAVLSDRPQLLFKYFKQLFAQVTNPPIDPIREAARDVACDQYRPQAELDGRIAGVLPPHQGAAADSHECRFAKDPRHLRSALQEQDAPDVVPRCRRAGWAWAKRSTNCAGRPSLAIKEGYKFLILSDRGVNEQWAPIPSLLGISAVHHHLVRECTRTEVGLILETGEPRDVHQFACLIGYGAGNYQPVSGFRVARRHGA